MCPASIPNPFFPSFLPCRSKSLALHTLRMKGLSSEGGENGEIPAGISFSDIYLSQEHEKVPFGVHPEAVDVANSLFSPQSADGPQAAPLSLEKAVEERAEAATDPEECQDKLYLHLKENLGKVKEFVLEMGRRIPIPEQCVIEGKRDEPSKSEIKWLQYGKFRFVCALSFCVNAFFSSKITEEIQEGHKCSLSHRVPVPLTV